VRSPGDACAQVPGVRDALLPVVLRCLAVGAIDDPRRPEEHDLTDRVPRPEIDTWSRDHQFEGDIPHEPRVAEASGHVDAEPDPAPGRPTSDLTRQITRDRHLLSGRDQVQMAGLQDPVGRLIRTAAEGQLYFLVVGVPGSNRGLRISSGRKNSKKGSDDREVHRCRLDTVLCFECLPVIREKRGETAVDLGVVEDHPAPYRNGRTPIRTVGGMPFRASLSVVAPMFLQEPLPEGVLYDLGTLPAAMSGLTWPTLPTTTSETTVTDLAGLQAAIEINGTKVNVNGTITGTAIVRGDDVEIVGLPGSSIGSLNIDRDTHRVYVHDLTLRDANLGLPAAYDDELEQVVFSEALFITDVVFDNVVVNNPTENAFNIYGRRVAILNSDVTANWYSVWVGQTGSFFQQDVIIANCDLTSAGPEATVRILQTERSVVVDSTLTNGAKHNWRLHLGTTLAYCARNVLVNSGIMLTDPAEPSDTVGDFWFEDNTVNYTLANGVIITLDPYVRIQSGVISGNTFNMPVASGADAFEDFWNYGAVPGDWDLSGNIVNVV